MKMITKIQLNKTTKIAGLLLGLSILTQGINREFFAEKIKNKEDLVRIMGEEESLIRKDNLPRTIYCTYGYTGWGTAGSGKLEGGKYFIILDKHGRDRTIIRHELYHIYAGHCDRAVEKGEWKGLDVLKNELSARLYADFGLRF